MARPEIKFLLNVLSTTPSPINWLIYFPVKYMCSLNWLGILPSINGTESAVRTKNDGFYPIKRFGFNFQLGFVTLDKSFHVTTSFHHGKNEGLDLGLRASNFYL